MFGQAAGFAFLAALSPTALLVAAVYLGSASPRRAVLLYLAGAVLMSVAMAVVVLAALHAGGLDQPRERSARYNLRLGLGVAALGASLVLARRKPRPADPGRHGLLSRMTAHPAPAAAFASGLLVFAPSLSFIAAMQVIATAQARLGVVALAVLLVVMINVTFVWLPLLAHVAAADVTSRLLQACNGWLRANGRALAALALAVAGILLMINGIAGLAA